MTTTFKSTSTRQRGLEPLARSLEGCCSIHLSYWRNQNKESGKRDSNPRLPPWQGGALPTELFPHELLRSGRLDLNQWPPGPKPGALPTAPRPEGKTSFCNIVILTEFDFRVKKILFFLKNISLQLASEAQSRINKRLNLIQSRTLQSFSTWLLSGNLMFFSSLPVVNLR